MRLSWEEAQERGRASSWVCLVEKGAGSKERRRWYLGSLGPGGRSREEGLYGGEVRAESLQPWCWLNCSMGTDGQMCYFPRP